MKVHFLVRNFIVAVLLGSALLRAQTFPPLSDPLLDRLHRAETATTLTREGVNPFYLKIDVQLYDAKGKPSEKGTIEEWWAGESTEKTVFTTPSYTATQLRKGDEVFRSTGASYPPHLLKLLLDQVIHPLPSRNEIDFSKAVMEQIKIGTVPLECIVLQLHSDPDGMPPQFCFDPGKDSLRLTYQYGERLAIRNGVGTFQKEEVPIDVTVRMGNVMAATGHISALTSRPVPASEVSTDGLTEKVFFVSPLGVKGKAVREDPPVYPELAKREHLFGKVVVYAVVGTDGHLHDLSIVSSPSPIFNDATLAAVGKYVFDPYIVNGEPQKIETMISVNFTFGTH